MAHPCMLYGWYGRHDQSDQFAYVLFEVTWPDGYTAELDYEPGPYPQVPEWYSRTYGEEAWNAFLKSDPAEMVWMDVVTHGTIGQVKIGTWEGYYGDLRDGAPPRQYGVLPTHLTAMVPMCDTSISPLSNAVQDYIYLAQLWCQNRWSTFNVGRGYGYASVNCLGALDPTTGQLLAMPYPPGEPEVVAYTLGTVDETTNDAGEVIVDGSTTEGTSLL